MPNASDQAILQLVEYGLQHNLLPAREKEYAINLLLDLMHQDAIDSKAWKSDGTSLDLAKILDVLLDSAVKRGLVKDSIVYKDLFDAKLMNTLLARPAQIQSEFEARYLENPKAATDWFYTFSQDSNYIRRDRIAKDERWISPSPYGDLEISINLSKPEKDPKAIAAAKEAVQSDYPKCQLCVENEGYAGRVNHPGRANHRLVSIAIDQDLWAFQYSPYVYFNEHCIVLNSKHIPMTIHSQTFSKLFDFLDLFPHYFIGSNADLPIVGGSILAHEHFQGGRHEFPMAKAALEKTFPLPDFSEVQAGIVHWPLSVIRLTSPNRQELEKAASHILETWRNYSDPSVGIVANDGKPHNTITPIARKKKEEYELDLVLRCNITTPEHPLGLFHPHEEWHHIKKENIGLIEVMGLAILPARLKQEMEDLKAALLTHQDPKAIPSLAKHAKWAQEVLKRHPEFNEQNASEILQAEMGDVFCHVLEDAGVYKKDEAGRQAFDRFLQTL
ncbi:MAG: UDP-glucose--hexose-1-phosphate uridylyltransferase [Allobaculum sp.]|nr:UDP-glucose--hexose-1-phosphate uridylyltransferase [Allobaculum sp.]